MKKRRGLLNEWILITYDIPATEKGKAARQKFLKTALKIGAVMHSRSVYLMPNTREARLSAAELSKIIGAKVCIWPSKVEEKFAVQITSFYDKKIQEQIETIEDRIVKEEVLVKDEKFGMADRMHRKTANLLAQLWFTVEQRGAPGQVIKKINQIENTFNGKK